jgi:MATE family multidrug resistance protein
VFAVIFIVFHQYLPQVFVNVNDRHVVETKEVNSLPTAICSCIFQISDGIQVVVLGALRGLQDVKIPMYITFGLLGSWFPISIYLGLYTDLKRLGFG